MSNKSNETAAWQLVISLIVLVCLVGSKLSCSTSNRSYERTIQTLERDGYSDTKVTGVRWFTCGETFVATGFVATSPNGTRNTTGAVCCGAVVRGCSIRTD